MSKKDTDEGVPFKKKPRKKRRIKRSAGNKKHYFDMGTQHAIERWQVSNDKEEKEKMYNSLIRPAFDQLVENLITIYRFTSLYDSQEDLKHDCIVFLYESLPKWDPSRGTKAFSYFNVVAKRWLIVRSKKRANTTKRLVSLSSVDHFGRDGFEKLEQTLGVAAHVSLTAPSTDEEMFEQQRINQLMRMLNEIRSKLTNENEIRCIDSIITLFEQREDLPMLNKRAVFTYIREMSDLTPKQLTMAVSVIKRHYNSLKMGDEFGIF